MCFSFYCNFIYNMLVISEGTVYFMEWEILFFYFPIMFFLLLTSDVIKSYCNILLEIEPVWKVQFFRNFIKTSPWTASLFIPAWTVLLSSFSWHSPIIMSEEGNQIFNFLGSEKGISLFQEPKILGIIYTVWINIG